jgi:diguanylate cyclase (GGDEF)-like protein
MEGGSASTRLPVRVSPFGPLQPLGRRLHELNNARRCLEMLALADGYEAAARAFGDHRTVRFVIQCRMYGYYWLGHYDEALVVGETLLAHHRADGNVLGEAKTLSDLACIAFRLGLVVEGMSYLARAGLLLEDTTRRNDRYVSALCSYAEAAAAAELYEVAASGYERLLAHLKLAVDPRAGIFIGQAQLDLLTIWGLRLDQLGYGPEAVSRLRRAVALAEDLLEVVTDPDEKREYIAARALPLAKLGHLDEAMALAGSVIAPLRAQGRWGAWAAHLALGIALRARGELAAARRELLAALRLSEPGLPQDVRPVVQHELAMLAAQAVGPSACADLLVANRQQAQRLWQQRLQLLAMLRQARRHEELEMDRARTEAALLFDPVTGLGSRRRFDQLMSAVDGRQLPAPVSMLIVDVDKFQAINDTHSHSAGDYVLREVGTILKANCRPADPLPVRYGGDEFVVFVHGDLPTAVAIAKRVREAVATADFDQIIPGTPVTVSAGVAMLRSGMTATELFRTADANLRRAKRDGRDRVIG